MSGENIPNGHIQPRDRAAYVKNQEHLKNMALKTAKWFPAAPPEPQARPVEPSPRRPWFRKPQPQSAQSPPATPRWSIDYRAWAGGLSSIMLLLGIGGVVTGAGYLSVQFLMNPRSVIWVNRYLPEPLQMKIAGWDQPRTLKEITAELKKSGLWFGDQIRLGETKQDADFIVPVFQNREDCVEDCQQIIELRVYRPVTHPYHKTKDQHFQMVSQLPVLGMDDWFVQEPFVNAQVDVPPPASTILSFSALESIGDQAPKNGIWLTLKGERNQVGTYGQVLHYNPGKSSLTAMVPWTSPANELPHWENVALGGSPELIVNQTIGLEPLFQVYLLEPDHSNLSDLKLRAISLTKPVLEARDYSDALKLAKSGLWSMALQSLERLGEGGFKDNATAQLQRDVIRYHAKIFQAQSEQASASTSQQVQADLLDGRWEKAIKTIKASPADREEVIDLLNSDSGQLLKRLKTALEIEPGNAALQAWNAAMKMARGGKGSAIAWLKTQPNNADRRGMLADIVPSLNPKPTPSSSPSPLTPKPSIPPALPVENPNPNAINPNPTYPHPADPIAPTPKAIGTNSKPNDPLPALNTPPYSPIKTGQ